MSEASASRGLSDISKSDLRALLTSLSGGDFPPEVAPTTLQSRGFGHLIPVLQPYIGLGRDALGALVGAVLAERQNRRAPRLTLVWTGDDPGVGQSRYTRIVLPELFSQARDHVLLAGYSFDGGSKLFDSLHRSMTEHGTTASLFVDIQQLTERLKDTARAAQKDWGLLSRPLHSCHSADERGQAVVALFYQLLWPFGAPFPKIYFDPRTAAAFNAISLHAKCVVIDHRLSLITSANFTNRGQTRNFEAGVMIEDPAFATTLERQWANLVEAGVVLEGLVLGRQLPTK